MDTRTFIYSIHKTYVTSYNYVQLNMIFFATKFAFAFKRYLHFTNYRPTWFAGLPNLLHTNQDLPLSPGAEEFPQRLKTNPT